jgi:alkylhydroperoxidase/carboxymuconolactone decarboxylase family protein YurZ
MAGDPLKIFERLDPELLKLVGNTRELALAEGALPKKVKLLIAMALDASHGTIDAETLRVAQYISGVGSVYTAAHALKEVF